MAKEPSLDTLNPFSECFDPTEALASDISSVIASLPTKRDRTVFSKAQPLNNIAACISVETAPYRVLRATPAKPPISKRNERSLALVNKLKVVAERCVSRKRPRGEIGSSACVQGRSNVVAVPARGILRALHERLSYGPFSMLFRSVRDKYRVCVLMRERHALKGSVEGFVVAFDKHFNMVILHALLRDAGSKGVRKVGQLFIRGENVVSVRIVR